MINDNKHNQDESWFQCMIGCIRSSQLLDPNLVSMHDRPYKIELRTMRIKQSLVSTHDRLYKIELELMKMDL